jgi:hypothetical protein
VGVRSAGKFEPAARSRCPVVDVDDVDGIAAAPRRYLVDAAAAERAGRKAYSVVGQHCSPEKIAEQREDCYRAAIERWRQRPRGRLRRSRLERIVSAGLVPLLRRD